MISIKHILCPTDFSPHSGNAMRYALALSRVYQEYRQGYSERLQHLPHGIDRFSAPLDHATIDPHPASG